ncbi:MAG: extracellular solute-binding protein [bacterium]|nr:extracellular solute-binding protein [bacterium]
MSTGKLSRRKFIKGAVATAIAAPAVLRGAKPASALSKEEEGIVNAAKKAGGAGLNLMVWSLYYRNMPKTMEEFRKLTGIGTSKIQDISVFQIPQRSLTEAVQRSGTFDMFHIDTNMIPSLVSAGLAEPLDKYLDEAGFRPQMVGKFPLYTKYKGQTYGLMTDGNVHVQVARKDLMENPDEQKRFADKHGKPLKMPVTWEDNQQIAEFFHRPDQKLYGSGSLRNRTNGLTWWHMYFYSAGGSMFDGDMNPTINNSAGEYAMKVYLDLKKASPPEAPGWGTPQMIPQHYNGHIATSQYWDGMLAGLEGPANRAKKPWLYSVVPGSTHSGKLMNRSVSTTTSWVVNRHAKNKAQAAYLAMWWSTLASSTDIVGHPTMTFHDPWHPGHFDPSIPEGKMVAKVYSPLGMEAIKENLLITTPQIYLTGAREFWEALGKGLSEAYVGQITAKQALVNTERAWTRLIGQIGKKRLKEEMATYLAMFPDRNTPKG